MTIYAFTFDCFDRVPDPTDGSTSRANDVSVTIIAESYDLAEEDVKNVCPNRQFYTLEDIVELNDAQQPIKPSRY